MNTVSTRIAGRREWLGLAVLALPCLLYSMDLTVLELALPRLVAALSPTSSELLWIVDVYGFVLAGALVTMGTLGDRIGRRRLLLCGGAAFGATSVVAAFSASARMLIASRALLGLAGATLAPSTLSLILAMFSDARQRNFAIGVWAASYSVGGAIGPILGGLLLERFWWGSVFLPGVPVMLVLLLAGPALLPEVKGHRRADGGRIDLVSAGLSLGAVLSAVYGVKDLAKGGGAYLPAFVIATVLGRAFVARQRRTADPWVDLGMFRSRAFKLALATNVLGVFVIFGVYLFIAQDLQLVLGLSPLQAGCAMLPSAAGFTAGSMLAPIVAQWVRPFLVIAGGFVLSAAGLLLVARFPGLAGIAVGSAAFSLGLASVPTLATALIVGSAPPEQAGAASGIAETSSELGGALGIALFGSFGTVIYRANLPDGISAQTDTLAGAVALAAKLAPGSAAPLLATTRDAFERSLQLSAAMGATILLASAVAIVLLRRGTNGSDVGEHRSPEPIEGA
jgi:DHA2 family multidrug resistance protein-like MFS transporter